MQQLKWPQPNWLGGLALFVIFYGVLTLKEGGSVLFINGDARQAAGQYVPFVLWFNFLAGFAYIIAGGALWMNKPWVVWLAVSIALATLLVFIAFGGHVISGGPYEQRTVIAMSMRALVWVGVTVITWRHQLRRKT